jgi:hypothetical protein
VGDALSEATEFVIERWTKFKKSAHFQTFVFVVGLLLYEPDAPPPPDAAPPLGDPRNAMRVTPIGGGTIEREEERKRLMRDLARQEFRDKFKDVFGREPYPHEYPDDLKHK